MSGTSRRRRGNAALLGLALGVLLGLAASPRSRWIIAAHGPRAFAPQAAPTLGLRPSEAAELGAFGARGPADARAVALRHAAERDEGRNRRGALQMAEAGAARDPANGFYPAMNAAVLYAEGRQAEGRAMLHRAATRAEWRDAIPFEVESAWAAADADFGVGNPMARAAAASSVALPRYPLLVRAARSALEQAAERERAGRTAEAAAIRRDVLALGRLIRVQSSSLSGSLAGAEIEDLAGGRGARAAVMRVAVAGAERDDMPARLSRFTAWLAAGQHLLSAAVWAALLAAGAGLVGRWTRWPVLRRISMWALPLACLLVLVYGAATLQTLRMAASVNRNLAAMAQHEGRYLAERAGLSWPDANPIR